MVGHLRRQRNVCPGNEIPQSVCSSSHIHAPGRVPWSALDHPKQPLPGPLSPSVRCPYAISLCVRRLIVCNSPLEGSKGENDHTELMQAPITNPRLHQHSNFRWDLTPARGTQTYGPWIDPLHTYYVVGHDWDDMLDSLHSNPEPVSSRAFNAPKD